MEESKWREKFWDLLEVESGLVYGSAIGLVSDHPFTFQVEDATPIRERAIPYSAQERDWINKFMKTQEELQIMRKLRPGDKEPNFSVGVVLVKGGQS